MTLTVDDYELAVELAAADEDKCNCYSCMCECLFGLKKREESLSYYNKSLELAKDDYDIFMCNVLIGKYHYESVFLYI